MSRRRSFRWWMWCLAAAGLLLAGGIGLRLALLDGWLRTVRIDGPSMAPALCGTHLDVTCCDCRISFRVDGERLPDSGRLVCPNCGLRELVADDFPLRPGDTVLVDRWPLLSRSPRRWEVVAYDDPHAGGAAVKRIAGLPGEKISIQSGDLYANGRIVRKSLAEFWQTAVLVHDDTFQPESAADQPPPTRWRPSADRGGWQADRGGYRFQPAGHEAAGDPDWLEYIHWRCDASLTPRGQPAAILDNDPYNQGAPRRLNEVHDLLLSCQAELPAGGNLTLALWSRDKWLEVRLDARRQAISASADGKSLATAASPSNLGGRQFKLIVGQFDAQLVAAIDGKAVLLTPLDAPPSDAPATARCRIRISAASAAWVGALKVWRDVYCLEPRGTGRPWTAEEALAESEFFVLGDNAPVSIDSRHWRGAGIRRGQVRGIVRGSRSSAP